MKIRNSILAAAAFLTVACSTPNKDLVKFSVNRPVRQIEQISGFCQYDYVALFNEKGQADEILFFVGLDDSLATFDDHGKYIYKEKYEYDSRGRVSRKLTISSDGETEGIHEYYYEGDRVSDCRFYGRNSNLIDEWQYSWKDGRLSTSYFNEGTLDYLSEKDNLGLNYDETVVGAFDNELILSTSHVENFSEGKPTRIVGDEIDVTVEYDKDGLPVHAVNAIMTSFFEIYYNESLIDAPERWYTYEYDGYGNWIVRREYSDADLAVQTDKLQRRIVYAD